MEPLVRGEEESLDLFEAATRKREEEGDSFAPLPTAVEKVIQALVELVMTTPPDKHITRNDVHERLGRALDRPRWKKVDDFLHLHPTVLIERGAQNRVLYRRRS
jgi:hypothetical protein